MTTTTNDARLHVCPACARRFVVVAGRSVAGRPRCVCGAELDVGALPGGVYELTRSRRATRMRGKRPAPAPQPAIPKEPDQGYGESHGYGPAHGGPTGPGDAPSPTPPIEPTASTDDDGDRASAA